MIIDKILLLNLHFVQTFGYIILFIAIFLDSLPFIGAFIPGGSIAIFFAGVFSKLGFFNLALVIAVCFIASVSIDIFGFFLGRYSSGKALYKYSKHFYIKKELIEKVGSLVHKHTGKALIIGRLNPATRSIAPFVVGNHKVKFSKFLVFSMVGGFLWVVLCAFLGYILGNSYKLAASFEKYILIITTLLLIGLYTYYILGFSSKKKKTKCKLDKRGLKCR
jgi:membrane-associated protein